MAGKVLEKQNKNDLAGGDRMVFAEYSWRRLAVVFAVSALAACGGSGGGDSPPPAVPALALTTTTLSFPATEGGAAPAAQTVTVTNSSTGTLAVPTTSIAYASGSGWLTATISGSAAPFTVTVQPSIGALSAGQYNATVSVTSVGASNSPQTFTVWLNVAAAPQPAIALSTTTLSFSATEGGAAPPAQTVTATNSGTGTLAVPTTSIAYASGAAWLTATISGAAAPFTITVQPSIGALSAGQYNATVSVTSAGASNSPQTFTVSLNVAAAPQPAIALSTAVLSFSGTNAENPSGQTVTVTNSGAGTLAPPTTSIAYGSGTSWLSATVTGTATPYTITVQPLTSELTPGDYTATVSVSSDGASNSPQSIAVSLHLDATWTVFVYGHADHNLSYSLYRDMVEMNGATIGSKLTVIVAADWSAGRALPNGTAFPSGTEWYRIVGSGSAPVLVGTQAETNFDNPANLQAAAGAVFASYPADRYGVILWDHGGSWQGGFGGDENNTPGVPADDGNGMSAAQVAGALSSAVAAAGLAGTRPLEFVAFDTCLMAGNEVAFEFRDLAKVYLADAEIDFGDGWDYTGSFTYLSANTNVSAQTFAEHEVGYWDAQHVLAGISDTKLRSHVAIDLALFSAYATEWTALVTDMLGSSTLNWFDVARGQFSTEPGYGMSFDDPVRFADLRDAGQFLTALSQQTSDATVALAAQDVSAALDAAVIASSNGSLRVASAQKGVHVEAPLPRSWANRRSGYLPLAWNSTTDWASVLDTLAARADATGPAVSTSLANGTSPTTANPPTLTLSAADADTAEGRVYLAEAVSGYVFYYGLIGMGAMLPGAQYQFIWDGSIIGLSDNVTASEITLLPWIRGANPVFVAPGTLSDGAASVRGYAILDVSTNAVSSMFLVQNGRLATFDVADFRGLSFTPVVLEATTNQWVPATPLTIPNVVNASLTVFIGQAAPGTYGLLTDVVDVWGNAGSAGNVVTVTAPF